MPGNIYTAVLRLRKSFTASPSVRAPETIEKCEGKRLGKGQTAYKKKEDFMQSQTEEKEDELGALEALEMCTRAERRGEDSEGIGNDFEETRTGREGEGWRGRRSCPIQRPISNQNLKMDCSTRASYL